MSAALVSTGVQPEYAASVVQNLTRNGFTLVPVTIIGRAGWTPAETWAYQAGYMSAVHDVIDSPTAFPLTEE